MKNNFIERLYKQIRMSKDLTKGFFKLFTTKNIVILVVIFVLAFILLQYSKSKKSILDGYDGGMDVTSVTQPIQQMASSVSTSMSQPIIPTSSTTGGYMARDTGVPSDLLPTDNNSKFNDFNMLTKSNVVMPDLLDAGYLIGLDTIGQSLRNANLQERSDPVIPKTAVGPWNNSTIEPDLGRVPLELGCGIR
jgi:hypothetical protein